MATEKDIILELADYQRPTTLYQGPVEDHALELAAAITAGYSKASRGEEARVVATGDFP